MFIRKYWGVLAFMSGLLAPLQSHAAPSYTVTALPAGFHPDDINNRGQIAGTISLEDGSQHAGLFSGGTITDLNVLGGAYSVARSLNNAGAVTGVALTGSGETHGFVYRNASVTDLGAGTNPFAINARGDVVGQVERGNGVTGFLYTHGKLVLLEGFAAGKVVNARDINDAGAIAGDISLGVGPNAPIHPFVYRNGVLTDLGTLGGQPYNSAQAINNAGRVAGFSQVADGSLHAFIAEKGVMTDVGSFGGTNMNIGDINERGAFVGSASTQANMSIGFAYLDGALVDLNTLIDPASGWYIDFAYGINDLGQIVANGCRNGSCSGIRLDLVSAVPEPAAASMLLPGLLMLLVGKRRQWLRSRPGCGT